MSFVLDATALRSGRTFSGDGWYTTPDVVEEVRLGRQARNLEMLLETTIDVHRPSKEALERVEEMASSTNDLGALSGTDLGVLALALELGATLVSDDYAVQNVASRLNIPVDTDLAGIRETVEWTFRCRGCGRYFDTQPPDCPVCGSEIRRAKRK